MYIDEKEIAEKKVQDIRNKKEIDKQLREAGISTLIVENPRYQSILSRISYMIRNEWARKDFSVDIDSSGNVVLTQTENGQPVMVMKYYIDQKDKCLKRVKLKFNVLGEEEIKTISTYNSDGIETSVLLEHKIDYDEKYLTKTTRPEGRPDLIKIERIEQSGKEKNRLPDVYQSRIFWAALEDIAPDAIDVDPFDIYRFQLMGFPQTYQDVEPLEEELIRSGIIEIASLLELGDRTEMFKLYRTTNATFNRITSFEEGIADLLEVDMRTIDDESLEE